MDYDPFFGKFSAGLVFTGIVNDRGALKAEFGPLKFQHSFDTFLSTLRLSFAELDDICRHPQIIPLQGHEKYNYAHEIDAGINELERALRGLDHRAVSLQQFPAPERNISMLADTVKFGLYDIIRMPQFAATLNFQSLFNFLALSKIDPETTLIPAAERRLADRFARAAWDRVNGPTYKPVRQPLPECLQRFSL